VAVFVAFSAAFARLSCGSFCYAACDDLSKSSHFEHVWRVQLWFIRRLGAIGGPQT